MSCGAWGSASGVRRQTAEIAAARSASVRGIVRFRFFPAKGTRVEIDGKAWTTPSNLVSAELPAGQHSLVPGARSGKRIARSVVVEDAKTTNIGTIDPAQ